MNYNLQAIGERIKEERINAGYKTQSEFAKKLNYSDESRQTIGKWEKGKALPPLDVLLKMCDIFNCELGYLLCEYNCKTRAATDIKKVTGLSQEAIYKLIEVKEQNGFYISIISRVIENPEFRNLLILVRRYIHPFDTGVKKLAENEIDSLSRLLKCNPDEFELHIKNSIGLGIVNSINKIIEEIAKDPPSESKPLFNLSK